MMLTKIYKVGKILLLFTAILFVWFILFGYLTAEAATTSSISFFESFGEFTLGDLDGQFGWIQSTGAGADFQIGVDAPFSGDEGLVIVGSGAAGLRAFATTSIDIVATGTVDFLFFASNQATSNNSLFKTALYDSQDDPICLFGLHGGQVTLQHSTGTLSILGVDTAIGADYTIFYDFVQQRCKLVSGTQFINTDWFNFLNNPVGIVSTWGVEMHGCTGGGCIHQDSYVDFVTILIEQSISAVMVTPTPDSSREGDISHWRIDYTMGAQSLSGFWAVGYTDNPTFVSEFFDIGGNSSYIKNSTGTVFINKQAHFNGFYRAKIFFFDFAENLIFSSNEINFSISGSFIEDTSVIEFGFDTTVFGTTSTFDDFLNNRDTFSPFATSSPFYVDCTQYSGNSFFNSSTLPALGCYGAQALSFVAFQLFFPHDFSRNIFDDSLNLVKSVPPYSLVFSLTGDLRGNLASTSDATSQDLTIGFPNFNDSSTLTTLTVLSSTTLTDAFTTPHCDADCASSFKDTIFNAMRMGIWISAGLAALGMFILL